MRLIIDLLESHPNKAVFGSLRNALKDPDADRRLLAVTVLGEPGADEVSRAKWLAELLDDPSVDVQIAVIEGLRKLGLADENTIERLAMKLVGKPEYSVQTALVRTLRTLGARASAAQKILAVAIGDRRAPDTVRIGAAIVLGGMGGLGARPLCQALSADDCLEVRQVAGLALRGIMGTLDRASPEFEAIASALEGVGRYEKDRWLRDLLVDGLADVRKTHGVRREAHRTIKDIAPDDETVYPVPQSPPEIDGSLDEEEAEDLEPREEQERAQSLRHAKLSSLIAESPARSYSYESERCREFFSLAKQDMANRLTPSLNEHLRKMPQETYIQKQAIASWVNAELRELGLAIRCPKTGKPAILIADIRGGEDDTSRFRLEVQIDGRRHRTFTGSTLPHLELMEGTPRHEGLARPQPERR